MSERGEKQAREACERMLCMVTCTLVFFFFPSTTFSPPLSPLHNPAKQYFPILRCFAFAHGDNKILQALIKRNCSKSVNLSLSLFEDL